MEWFRFYSEALNDPKVQHLQGDVFKVWINLLCLANMQPERGALPAFTDIAWALRLPQEEFDLAFDILFKKGLVDCTEDTGRWVIHGWENRQRKSDNVTERVQKHREKSNVQASNDGNVTETEPETLPKRSLARALRTEQNREEEKREEKSAEKRSRKSARLPWTLIPEDFTATKEMRQWAVDQGYAHVDFDKETAKFIKYWTIGNGAGKKNKNWLLTWENWIERAAKDAPSRNGHIPPVDTNMPGEGYSFDKDEYGNFLHLRGSPLPYGAKSVEEVDRIHLERWQQYGKEKRNLQGVK